MIKYIRGNIFASTTDCIVNPVNCVGAMGAGLALAFRQRYPELFGWYLTCLANGSLAVGSPVFCPDYVHYICLFPTKLHWRDPSTVDIIHQGLAGFVDSAAAKGITSATFPMLGCGLGGLQWAEVQPLMERYFANSDLYIEVITQPHKRNGSLE
jgi:O-acetyl-ADP-ribose deacetylase (regulator of RNase III)